MNSINKFCRALFVFTYLAVAPAAFCAVPVITSQPTNQTVSVGGIAKFSVTATGSPILAYQWYGPGSSFIPGALSPTLTLSNVQPGNAGAYFAVVTNLEGFAISSNAVLTVNGGTISNTPPVITKQPTNQTASVGGTASFSVTATGSPTLHYQWYGPGSSLIAGAINPTLTLSNVQPSNAGAYFALVTNLYGFAISSNAVLTVNGGTTSNCTPPSSGLAAWWPGEGNGSDIVGGNTAILESGVSFGAGKVGQSFQLLNDTNGFMHAPASASLNVGAGTGLTIEGWIKVSSVDGFHPIAEWYGDARNKVGVQLWLNSAPFESGALFGALPDTNSNQHTIVSAAGILVPDVFQHVAMTYDRASGIGTLYINGTIVAQSDLGSFVPQTSYDLWMGHRPFDVPGDITYGTSLGGSLDELSLYSRALSSNEIQAIYNAGSAGKCPPTLLSPPIITKQPTNQTVSAGGSASFSVTATGSPTLHYQWYGPGSSLIVGAINPTLTLSNAQPSNAGAYFALVTNLYGFAISSNAVLTVNGGTTSNCTPPSSGLAAWWQGEGNGNDIVGGNTAILESGVSFGAGKVGQSFQLLNDTNGFMHVPASASLNVGAGAGLTIEGWIKVSSVDGLHPIAEWYGDARNKVGVQLWLNSGPFQSGALLGALPDTNLTQHTLISAAGILVPDVFQHVAMTYDRASGIGTLYVNGAIVAQSDLGSFVPQTSYNLWMGHRPFDVPDDITYGTSLGGSLDELSLYNRALSSNEIQFIYSAGSAGKCPPTLSSPPVITKQPTNQTVSAGGSASFSVIAIGSPTLHYQWYGPGSSLIVGAINPTLTLSNVQPSNAGAYFAVVTNLLGFAISSNAVLIVNGGTVSNLPPVITKQPTNQTVAVGGTAKFVVTAMGSPTLHYQWYGPGSSLIVGAVSPTLTLSNVQPSNAGAYFALVTNLYGFAISSNGVLTVIGVTTSNTPPVITKQPTNQTVSVGGTASFSVTATGSPTLHYQWYGPGTNFIAGANNSTLTLSNVQPSNAGPYFVLVTNLYGFAISSNGVLTVNGGTGSCTPPPSGIAGWWRAENNADDSAGTNDAIVTDGINYTNGEVGQAFLFDGTSGYISVPASSNLDIGTGNGITLECWIKPDHELEGTGIPVIEWGTSGAVGLHLWIEPGLRLYANVLDDTGANHQIETEAGFISTDNLQHVALTYNKTNGMAFLYINGVPVTNANFGTITPQTSYPLYFGKRALSGWGQLYNGLLDEVSLYRRALSPAEIQAIYHAGSEGKCVAETPLVITAQPTNVTVTVGSSATFHVTAVGNGPLSYQWWHGSNSISNATSATLTLSNVQPVNAGTYHVVVSDTHTSVTSSNATLTVHSPSVATVAVVHTSASSGSSLVVPIVLVANGNENALSFSLSFDTNRLVYSDIDLGNNATNALLLPNVGQVGNGKLGVQLALPSGETFSAGTQQVVRVTFNAPIVAGTQSVVVAAVNFTGQPIAEHVSDALGQPLAANFVNGTVTLSPVALEADATPVPAGNGTIDLFDWVQVGRFVAGLDTITNGAEFQKVDCAPRNTLGDGQLKVTDWVQAGRYAAGLDPLTPAGGPTGPSVSNLVKALPNSLTARQLTVNSGSTVKGLTITLPVNLEAQGDETALAFSLTFNPAVLSYVSAAKGSGASSAVLNVNANQAGSGKLAFVLGLPAGGSHFSAGTKEIVKVTFMAIATTTNNSVSFADQPVSRSISDSEATELAANYVGSSIVVNSQPSVSLSNEGATSVLSWPVWAGDFTLQAANSIIPPIVWTNVPATLTTNSNNIEITLPTLDQQTFFRLYHP